MRNILIFCACWTALFVGLYMYGTTRNQEKAIQQLDRTIALLEKQQEGLELKFPSRVNSPLDIPTVEEVPPMLGNGYYNVAAVLGRTYNADPTVPIFTPDRLRIVEAEVVENIPQDFQWLITYVLAIGAHEQGEPGFEFGVKAVRGGTYEQQAGWCAATVYKNYVRWTDAGQPGKFITYLGNKYCPTNGTLSEAEKKLNKYWIPGVSALHLEFSYKHQRPN